LRESEEKQKTWTRSRDRKNSDEPLDGKLLIIIIKRRWWISYSHYFFSNLYVSHWPLDFRFFAPTFSRLCWEKLGEGTERNIKCKRRKKRRFLFWFHWPRPWKDGTIKFNDEKVLILLYALSIHRA
jgi:hypothetical protein